MSDKVLIFGGTTEGRILSNALREAGIGHLVSVATEYGKEILQKEGEEDLLVGRKGRDDIFSLIQEKGFDIVVDSTHPFATLASKEIKGACEMAGVTYLRLKRKTAISGEESESLGDVVYADSLDDAIGLLQNVTGRILLFTGSKDIRKIAERVPDVSKLYARVLPSTESIVSCKEAGLPSAGIIAMQGPFSAGMNEALIRETGAEVILTKESGDRGGFSEKLEAAKKCGIKTIVIKNPEESTEDEKTYDLREVLQYISEKTKKKAELRTTVTLAGAGPSGEEYYTEELKRALLDADIIFGAAGVTCYVKSSKARIVPIYKGEEIADYLSKNRDFLNPLVLFSGDISLCSGAKNAEKVLLSKGLNIKKISGISSVSLFLQRLSLSLENVRIISAHGRKCNVCGHVSSNEESVILPSDTGEAADICKELSSLGKDLEIVLGYRLGSEDEKIIKYRENTDLKNEQGKCLIYVKNKDAATRKLIGVSDSDMIRGDVPMTKEEIRSLCVRKLKLSPSSVLIDVGAGTGSVSVEAALLHPDISVYSIEKNKEAVDLLIQNKEKFGLFNMEIIEGTAPEALDKAPVPTCVFVGGSSGNLEEIVDSVLKKAPQALIVMNCVTAETFAGALEIIKKKGLTSDITEVFVNRYRSVGKLHMSDALNPVHIITMKKEKPDE